MMQKTNKDKSNKEKFQTNESCINFCYFTGPYSGRGSGRKIDQTLLNSFGNLNPPTRSGYNCYTKL